MAGAVSRSWLFNIYCSSSGVGTEWPRGQICPLILAFVHKVLLEPTQSCLFRGGLQSLKYLLYYCLLKTLINPILPHLTKDWKQMYFISNSKDT